MKIDFLNIGRQYNNLKDDIYKNINNCLDSCLFIEGPMVKQFENEVSKYLGVNHAITCANGTDALIIALLACGVGYGDEVITTPFSFFATSEAISAVGAVPVFVDINEDDFNINVKKIKNKITDKTKAILPVHIFGESADMDEINLIATQYGLRVIEDACQAIGSEYKGKKVGTLSDIACFSFYPTKNLGGFGDSGMLTTNSDEFATLCRAIKSHGAGINGAIARKILFSEAVETNNSLNNEDIIYDQTKYYNYIIGRNSRMDSLQAAVLLSKMPCLDTFNEARRKIAYTYNQYLSDLPLKLPVHNERFGMSCWHQYAILTPEKNKLTKYLKDKQIGVGEFYPVPLHLQKVYEKSGLYNSGDCPVAENVCKQSVCLPIYPELSEEEQHIVIDTIKGFYGVY